MNKRNPASAPASTFLSCLLGSEHVVGTTVVETGFLSCLLGSELIVQTVPGQIAFLSCLLGSEPQQAIPL